MKRSIAILTRVLAFGLFLALLSSCAVPGIDTHDNPKKPTGRQGQVPVGDEVWHTNFQAQ